MSASRSGGEVFCARSIKPFEGGRWRLRWIRAIGYGNSILSPVCNLLVRKDLETSMRNNHSSRRHPEARRAKHCTRSVRRASGYVLTRLPEGPEEYNRESKRVAGGDVYTLGGFGNRNEMGIAQFLWEDQGLSELLSGDEEP